PRVVVYPGEMTGDRAAVRGVPGTGERLRPGRPGGLVPDPDGAEPLAGVRGRCHAQPLVPCGHRTSGSRFWLRDQLYALPASSGAAAELAPLTGCGSLSGAGRAG